MQTKDELKPITAKEIVDYLNELLEADPLSINALFNSRIFCNEKMAKHPTQPARVYGNETTPPRQYGLVGIIGILNSLLDNMIIIDMDNGRITRFFLREKA